MGRSVDEKMQTLLINQKKAFHCGLIMPCVTGQCDNKRMAVNLLELHKIRSQRWHNPRVHIISETSCNNIKHCAKNEGITFRAISR